MPTLSDLHRQYEGFISRDELDQSDGLDPALIEAMGAVKIWRERVENAERAVQMATAPHWPSEYQARHRRTLAEAHAALARAEARLRLLRDPETAATKAVLSTIEGGTP